VLKAERSAAVARSDSAREIVTDAGLHLAIAGSRTEAAPRGSPGHLIERSAAAQRGPETGVQRRGLPPSPLRFVPVLVTGMTG
jgi:hypothetical protein